MSEHMTFALPSVSTAGSLLIIAFLLAMRWTPRASTMVTIAVRPSGMAATARLTAVMNMTSGSSPLIRPVMKTRTLSTTATMPSTLPSLSRVI